MIPLRTILVPVDFSEHSELAFRVACMLARDSGARVIALHVAAPPPVGTAKTLEERVTPTEKLAALQAQKPNIAIETFLLEGDAAEAVLWTARDRNCDLIVLGTHGRSGLAHVIMGSVAEKVVRQSPCPVLTVRAQVLEDKSFLKRLAEAGKD